MSSSPQERLGIACLGASVLLSALGQLAMKAGLLALRAAGGVPVTIAALFEPQRIGAIAWTLGGLSAYGVSLLTWLVVLGRYRLSHAYPLLASSYVLVYLGATQWAALNEAVSTPRTIGTALIVAGVALVSIGRDRR